MLQSMGLQRVRHNLVTDNEINRVGFSPQFCGAEIRMSDIVLLVFSSKLLSEPYKTVNIKSCDMLN